MEIRKAKPEDAGKLTQIALAAKQHWGYPARWIELWRPLLTITPAFIENHEVYAAAVGGEIVGLYALAGEGNRRTLEHLWVEPAVMGQGIGRALFAHALKRAAELQAEMLEIEADPNAESFYRHMGARRVGEIVSEIEGQSRILPLLVAQTGHLSGA